MLVFVGFFLGAIFLVLAFALLRNAARPSSRSGSAASSGAKWGNHARRGRPVRGVLIGGDSRGPPGSFARIPRRTRMRGDSG